MLAVLLDEQITPLVARQVRSKRPDAVIAGMREWRGGAFCGKEDRLVLTAAAADNITLVTYDLKTIPRLLAEWAACGVSHGGVLFVDGRTIPQDDVGGLVRALIARWDACHLDDWRDRVEFLERSP